MTRFALPLVGWSAIIAAALLASPSPCAAKPDSDEAAPAPAEAKARQLVQQALAAEAAGQLPERRRLLAAALVVDPDSSPARWQSGQVRFRGQWRSLAEVEKLLRNDPRLADYRRLRDSLDAELAPEGHRSLARWCDENGLSDEARYHWAMVLNSNYEDREAQAALAVRPYNGSLLTDEQIADIEARRKKFRQDLEDYAPEFRKLVRDVASGDTSLHDAALAKIRAIRDPAMIPAAEQVISIESVSKKKGPLARLSQSDRRRIVVELHNALLGALGDMHQPEATIDLLNYALSTSWPEIYTAAVDAIRLRPETEYIPRLMAELAAPIEAQFDMTVGIDGSMEYFEQLYQPGPERDRILVRGISHVVQWTNRVDRSPPPGTNTRRVESGLLGSAAASAGSAQTTAAAVEAKNDAIARRNKQVAKLLNDLTGNKGDRSPQEWWDAWSNFNELSLADEEPETTYDYQYTPTYLPGFAYYPPPLPVPPSRPGRRSCFVAGTPVWTREGKKPIEEVRAGDFVLSQDPATGELAYRVVVGATLRTPSPLMQIDLPGESIKTTRGHRFWVSGHGWEMAKLLKPGMSLHGVDGSVETRNVVALAATERAEAYNLIVDGFHTYFVGDNKLLVQDNGCPGPTRGALPGMAPAENWTKLASVHDWIRSDKLGDLNGN